MFVRAYFVIAFFAMTQKKSNDKGCTNNIEQIEKKNTYCVHDEAIRRHRTTFIYAHGVRTLA